MAGSNPSDNTSQHLPTLLPPAALVLKRAQTTLSLLRDVVQESSADYWYERGKKASAIAKWEEAIVAFRACTARDPNHWRATLQMTNALAQSGQYEAAALALDKAYYMPDLKIITPQGELSQVEWNSLRICFEQSQEKSQNSFSILLALALINSQLSCKSKRQYLSMIQNLYPLQVAQSSTWHILSGKANDNNGIAALDYFNYATDLSPTDASVYYRVGLAKDEWDFQGSLDGYSIDDYIKAAELDNNHPYANYKAGNKYSRYSCYNPEDQREAYIKAMHHLNRAIEINPNFIDAYLDRAHLHSNFDNAIADYDRAIELDPTRLDIHGFKANVHSRKGEHLEAIKIYGYIIQINPTDSEVYVNRGDAKSKLGDYKGAISDYSKRIELEPRDRYIYKERAIIKEKLGDFDGATADRQKFQDFYNR